MDKKLKQALSTFESYVNFEKGVTISSLSPSEVNYYTIQFNLQRMNGDEIDISIRQAARAFLYENGHILNRPGITVNEICAERFSQTFQRTEVIVGDPRYKNIIFVFDENYSRSKWTNRILVMVKKEVTIARIPERVTLRRGATIYFVCGYWAGDKLRGMEPQTTTYKRLQ